MTPAERKRHAAAILKLRQKRRRSPPRSPDYAHRGHRSVNDSKSGIEGEVASVDKMFEARQRSGRFPKGCWR